LFSLKLNASLSVLEELKNKGIQGIEMTDIDKQKRYEHKQDILREEKKVHNKLQNISKNIKLNNLKVKEFKVISNQLAQNKLEQDNLKVVKNANIKGKIDNLNGEITELEVKENHSKNRSNYLERRQQDLTAEIEQLEKKKMKHILFIPTSAKKKLEQDKKELIQISNNIKTEKEIRKEIRKEISDKKIEVNGLNDAYKKLEPDSKDKQDKDYSIIQEKEKELTKTGEKLEERKREVTPKGRSTMLARLYNDTKEGLTLKGKTNMSQEGPKMENNSKKTRAKQIKRDE